MNPMYKHKFFTTMLTRWGWVFIFLFFTTIMTERALKRVSDEHLRLEIQLNSLQEELASAYKMQSRLTQQINSQSDPEWIELVLKSKLGLIPEGQTKVLFIQKPPT